MVPRDAERLDDATWREARRIWTSPLPNGAGTQAVSAGGWTFHPLAGARGRVGLLAVAQMPHGRTLAEQPGLGALLEHAATVIERATPRDAPTAVLPREHKTFQSDRDTL
jgi:hypothetical protein